MKSANLRHKRSFIDFQMYATCLYIFENRLFQGLKRSIVCLCTFKFNLYVFIFSGMYCIAGAELFKIKQVSSVLLTDDKKIIYFKTND